MSPSFDTFVSRLGLLRLLDDFVSLTVLTKSVSPAFLSRLMETFVSRPVDLANTVEGPMMCDPLLLAVPALSDVLKSTEESGSLTELCVLFFYESKNARFAVTVFSLP